MSNFNKNDLDLERTERIIGDNKNKVSISNEETERIDSVSKLAINLNQEKNNRVKNDLELATRLSNIEKNSKALQYIIDENFTGTSNKNFQIQQQIAFETGEINTIMKELKDDLENIKKDDLAIIKDDINKVYNNISNLVGFSGGNNNSNVDSINRNINELRNIIQNMNVSVDNSSVLNEINRVESDVNEIKFDVKSLLNKPTNNTGNNQGNTTIIDNTSTINRIDNNTRSNSQTLNEIRSDVKSVLNKPNNTSGNNQGNTTVIDNTSTINRIDQNVKSILNKPNNTSGSNQGNTTVIDNTSTISRIDQNVKSILNKPENTSLINEVRSNNVRAEINSLTNNLENLTNSMNDNNISMDTVKLDTNTIKNSVFYLQSLVEELSSKIDSLETTTIVSQPSTENPSTENPSTENPSTENQSTENPSTENPSTENPSTVVPVTEVKPDNRTFQPDETLTETLDIVLFMADAEIGTEAENKLISAIRYGSKFRINLINAGDIGINKENFSDKFLFYYNRGVKHFVSKAWSSRLSVLNEFFNNIEQTNPEVNLNEIIYIDIGSTAPNLVNKDGSIAKRNKYITRIIPNDVVSGQIVLRKFNDEIIEYEECVIIYINDPYGIYFFDIISKACIKKGIPIKVFTEDEIASGVEYLNNTTKNTYCLCIIFTTAINYLFENISNPFLRKSKAKLKIDFTETLAFNSDIINTSDYLLKFNRYNCEFYQYVGANSSISFIRNNLNVNLEGSSNIYLIIDALDIIGISKNLKINNKKDSLYNIFLNLVDNYYGLSGNTLIDPVSHDRAITMYNFTYLKINTVLDKDPRNDPFPYAITSMYQEDNKITKISYFLDSNEEIEDTFESGIFLFSNFFIMNMKMLPNHIQRGNNITSTYGLGSITKVQNISQTSAFDNKNFGIKDFRHNNQTSNDKNFALNLETITASENNDDLLFNLKKQLGIITKSLDKRFNDFVKFIVPSLILREIAGDDSLLLETINVQNTLVEMYKRLQLYLEKTNNGDFKDNIYTNLYSKNKIRKFDFNAFQSITNKSTHQSGYYSSIIFEEEYSPKINKNKNFSFPGIPGIPGSEESEDEADNPEFIKFRNSILADLEEIDLEVGEDGLGTSIANLSALQSQFFIDPVFIGVVNEAITGLESSEDTDYKRWISRYESITQNWDTLKNRSIIYTWYFTYLYSDFTGDKLLELKNILFLTKMSEAFYV